MCEGYWDRRLGRWVSLEELEEQERELESLLTKKVALPAPPPVETKRKPAMLAR